MVDVDERLPDLSISEIIDNQINQISALFPSIPKPLNFQGAVASFSMIPNPTLLDPDNPFLAQVLADNFAYRTALQESMFVEHDYAQRRGNLADLHPGPDFLCGLDELAAGQSAHMDPSSEDSLRLIQIRDILAAGMRSTNQEILKHSTDLGRAASAAQTE